MPAPQDIARIDANAPCPVCGARSGALRCVQVVAAAAQRGIPNYKIVCQHTCDVCAGNWFEEPVVKVTLGIVSPAVARNDEERFIDNARAVALLGAK